MCVLVGVGGRLSCGWSFFSFLKILGHSQWPFLATSAKSCLSFGSQGNLLGWGGAGGGGGCPYSMPLGKEPLSLYLLGWGRGACPYSVPVGNEPNPLSLYPFNGVSTTQCASPYRDLHQGATRRKGRWQFIESDLSSSLQRSSD